MTEERKERAVPVGDSRQSLGDLPTRQAGQVWEHATLISCRDAGRVSYGKLDWQVGE